MSWQTAIMYYSVKVVLKAIHMAADMATVGFAQQKTANTYPIMCTLALLYVRNVNSRSI